MLLGKVSLTMVSSLGVKMHLPLDHRCATEFKDVEAFCTPDENIPDDMMALDIGPKTEERMSRRWRWVWCLWTICTFG